MSKPPSPVVELVVIFGKLVCGGDSEVVVIAGRLVSDEESEDFDVSLAVEDASDVSALLDVLDGAAVEAADEEALPSVDVSDKAGNLGACASTVVKGNIANRNRNKNFMGATFSLEDRRMAGKMREVLNCRAAPQRRRRMKMTRSSGVMANEFRPRRPACCSNGGLQQGRKMLLGFLADGSCAGGLLMGTPPSGGCTSLKGVNETRGFGCGLTGV